MARTIQSPGVEVKEVDLSLRPAIPVGTTVFIPGFANQGPTDELLTVSSLSEFEQVYGLPQNSAERYMYHSVKAVFQSPANILVSRLPYGEGAGATVADKFSVQAYPVIPRPIMIDGANPELHTIGSSTEKIAYLKPDTGDFVPAVKATKTQHSVVITAATPGEAGNSITVTVSSTALGVSVGTDTVDTLVLNYTAPPTTQVVQDAIIAANLAVDAPTGGDAGVASTFSGTVSAAGAFPAAQTATITVNADDVGTTGDVTLIGDGIQDVDALALAHGTDLTVTDGGAEIPVLTAEIILAGGEDSTSWTSENTVTLANGAETYLGSRTTPDNWEFHESTEHDTLTASGYVGTTLKDAVDSVLLSNATLSSQSATYWDEAIAGDPTSIPALKGYECPEIAEVIADAVNSVGWDLSASDRYYIGEPSNIELDNASFQKTIKGEIKLSQHKAGKKTNQKFTTFDDLKDNGGCGFMIVNDKKFVINEKFEGYYLGISDNTNLNPATDFDAVGKLKSLSKRLGGTTGGYVDVPDADAGLKSRLTFSLSAGFIFDQYGNKQQIGLDGSMSEVLENLSEYDLNTDEFSDVLSIAVFKVRQSTLEPDATKLDYLVADSVIGSVNFFREAFKSDGGTATSYFIESEAENSNNLYFKLNEGISKDAGNWLDESGYPTRKIRMFPAKDARYFAELPTPEQSASDGEEVVNFRVSQAFLNGAEETQDRLYIKSWQDLQRGGTTNVKHGNNVYPHGVYRKQLAAAKETGNIPAKLDRIFELADNFDLFPIDITCEAGLGTVYVGTEGGTVDSFDDEEYYNIGDHSNSSVGLSGNGLYTTKIIDNRSQVNYLVNYDTIFDRFKSFSQFQRKDNIFIADPLRYIFVQGRNSKTLTSKQREAGVNFSQHIYWPLRHMMTGGAKNSSYCCTYANWAFTNDKALNRGVWCPMSGYAAAAMGNTDSNFYPWIAPAGFTRGLVSGIQDLAFYPKQKERDQLYKIGLNPVANFPNEGYAIFGQKTMQAKPSAFDRINVRRLFLYLQKAVMNTVKFFVFEPNTLFTRTQVLNVLRPIFEEVKQTQGMYDYLLVCDERNNSPDVIDRNELVIDIYIKPTRAAEFILVNFYATRTGQDFSELVS